MATPVILLRNIYKLRLQKTLYPLYQLSQYRGITYCSCSSISNKFTVRPFSTNKTKEDIINNNKSLEVSTTSVQKLKRAVAQYGTTIIVFHIGISLISLGICYVLVSSGVDVSKVISSLGIKHETFSNIACNAGIFGVAYAIHKLFAPVRIGITLTAAPFVVRYLRHIGIVKEKM